MTSTRSFLATRSLHMAIVSSICPFNGRMVIFGSSSPVGRIICSTIRGVERLVGSNFSTGSVDGLGATRMSLGEVNKIPLNPSGAFSPDLAARRTGIYVLLSARQFTSSNGPGVAEAYTIWFCLSINSWNFKGLLSRALGRRNPCSTRIFLRLRSPSYMPPSCGTAT